MPTLYTKIEINAPRSTVWEALIRKDEWRRWNTFLFDADPALPIRQGRAIFLSVRRLEDDKYVVVEPLVTLVQPSVCLRWTATMPGFKSEHSFELQDLSPTRTLYIHQERIQGALSGVFLPFIRQDEKKGIQRMARQLKRYVEHREYRQYRQEKRDRRYGDRAFPTP